MEVSLYDTSVFPKSHLLVGCSSVCAFNLSIVIIIVIITKSALPYSSYQSHHK